MNAESDEIDLQQRLAGEGPLTPLEAAYVFLQVAEALAESAERGRLHRAVRPASVVLRAGGLARLVDFGDTRSTSVAYVSPEQVKAGRPDARSDVYSLGATMWHALMGSPPFAGPTALAIASQHLTADLPPPAPNVPRTLVTLLRRMLAKAPADRPVDAREVADALARFVRVTPKAPWALVVEPDGAAAARAVAECVEAGLVGVECRTAADAIAVLELRQSPPRIVVVQLGAVTPAFLGRAQALCSARPPHFALLTDASGVLDEAGAAADRLGLSWSAPSSARLHAQLAAVSTPLAARPAGRDDADGAPPDQHLVWRDAYPDTRSRDATVTFRAGGVIKSASAGMGRLFGCVPAALVGLHRETFVGFMSSVVDAASVARLGADPQGDAQHTLRLLDGRAIQWTTLRGDGDVLRVERFVELDPG